MHLVEAADQRLFVAKKAEGLPASSALQTKVEDAETKEDRMAARLDLAYALAAQRDVEQPKGLAGEY